MFACQDKRNLAYSVGIRGSWKMDKIADPVIGLIPISLLLALLDIISSPDATRCVQFNRRDLKASAIMGLCCEISNVVFAGLVRTSLARPFRHTASWQWPR